MFRGQKRLAARKIAAVMALPAVMIGVSAFRLSAAETTDREEFMAFPKAVPEPTEITAYVKDKKAAIKLGKALFWDMQVGSDGLTACATCHHHAGVDHRDTNQLNPGPNGKFDFAGANRKLTPRDFPFDAKIDDVIGSQGVHKADFVDIEPGSDKDTGVAVPDPIFNVNGVNVRQVTGKNAPSTINAVFNHRNFWNGRANNIFNGQTPFGAADPAAKDKIWKAMSDGSVSPATVAIDNASAASQSVGPPTSDVEMSYKGRTWQKLGKKMLALRPLAKQVVHPKDSLLGALSYSPKPGIRTNYLDLVKAAFQSQWWDSNALFTLDSTGTPVPAGYGAADDTDEYTLAEINFSLFWGLAIQLYEATLVSDDSPFDRFLKGVKDPAFGALEQEGFKIFNNGRGRCNQCHSGTLLTNATVDTVNALGRSQSGVLRDEELAFFDTGFRNIGIRPTVEDLGIGDKTPFGAPLSFSRTDHPNDRIAVDGAFKVPGLRNTALTGPFFHIGAKATLDDVAEFYHNRGDFRNVNRDNIDREFELVNIGGSDQRALVAFMKNGLVDQRVANEAAPFDHPELIVPNGALTTGADRLIRLPPTGASGRSAEGLPPLKPFLN